MLGALLALIALVASIVILPAAHAAPESITLPDIQSELSSVDFCPLTDEEIEGKIRDAGIMPDGPYIWSAHHNGQTVIVQANVTDMESLILNKNGWLGPDLAGNNMSTYTIVCGGGGAEDKPVSPVDPEVWEGRCIDSGIITDPVINYAVTEGITYSTDEAPRNGFPVTVRATLSEGYSFSAPLPEGWTLAADGKSATKVFEIPEVFCHYTPQKQVPVMPEVTQAACTADGSLTEPKVVLAEGLGGVTYKIVGEVKAGSTVEVHAMLVNVNDYFDFDDTVWERVSANDELMTTIVLNAPECDKPVTPVDPEIYPSQCINPPTATDPEVVFKDTEGIKYEVVGEVLNGGTATVKATLEDGYKFVDTMPAGWTVAVDGKSATKVLPIPFMPCSVPVIEVTPEAPAVDDAVCNADGTVDAPEVNLPADSDLVTYTKSGDEVTGGTVEVRATLHPQGQQGSEGKWGDYDTAVWTPLDGDANVLVAKIVLKDVPCDKPVAPVLPDVTQAVCQEDGTVVDPKVVLKETEGITYTVDNEAPKAGDTVKVTATAKDGNKLAAAEGWTISEDGKTATAEIKLDVTPCDKPVTPVLPDVTQAVCQEDGTVVDPKVTLAATEGVEYTIDNEAPKAGDTVKVTATATDGKKIAATEGWTVSEDGLSATADVVLDETPCLQPVTPVLPDVTQIALTATGCAQIDAIINTPTTPETAAETTAPAAPQAETGTPTTIPFTLSPITKRNIVSPENVFGHRAADVLDALSVKGKGSAANYDGDAYLAAWADTEIPGRVAKNGCDTRNDILTRDMTNIVYRDKKHCIVDSGTLHDLYTGKTIEFVRGVKTSSAVQGEHVVARKNIEISGGMLFPAELKRQIGNDPLNLLAADGPTNGAKQDSNAAEWLPPNKAFRCDYVARQIAVKAIYGLSVTQPEKNTMRDNLKRCPSETIQSAWATL